jgi:hypothetical protein
MRNIVAVNPFRARMWSVHERCNESVNQETCKAEIESFEKHGQLVAVLGRVLRDDPDHDVELICGARRLFVAQHLNKPLLVDMREMSDREATIAMDIENRQRTDRSLYERAVSYARWLRNGHFGSQDNIVYVMASKLLMLVIGLVLLSGLVVVGGVIAARFICSIYSVRRQRSEDASRGETEAGAVPDERQWLPY